MAQGTLYIKIDRNILVHQMSVRLGEIASLECTEKGVVNKLKQLEIYRFSKSCSPKQNKKNQLQVFSILKIIQLIHQEYPVLQVQNEGETDFIVEYEPQTQNNTWIQIAKLVVLCVIIFFGAAFTIMAFNNDISITELFGKLYERVMGVKSNGFTELEVGYSIGLAVSILVFFNHFGQKKITHDPTPVQVELRKYEQDVDTTFVENAGRKGHNIDVD